MKHPILVLAVLGFSLGGCESASDLADTVRTKVLSPREEPRTREFAAPMRATYDAALRAAKDLDYVFVTGGPAEGRLKLLSPIETSGATPSSRQLALNLRLEPAVDGGTQVTASFTEILEPDSNTKAGIATETPLRDTPLYEVFFRGIQQQLTAPPKQ